MEKHIEKDGIVYSLYVNEAGEKIAAVVDHTPALVGTLERITPLSYALVGGPCYIKFDHNGSKYGPIELPISIPPIPVVKERLVDVVIPEEIDDGYKVLYIKDSALKGCYRIRKIALPKSMRSIYKYAFSNCCNLVHIDLQSEVLIDSIKSPFGNTSLHYLTVHNSESLISAQHLLTGLWFEREENKYINVTYPDTAISTIFIAADANISKEEIASAEKRYKVVIKD